MTGEIPERIAEDIDVLGAEESGTETVQVSRERLQHLRDIERLVLLYRDGLLDETRLRRALEAQFDSGERRVTPCRTLS